MPTIKELAREAGVSPSTVSIVLSGKSEERNIPESTQRRVWDAARKLDYHPNVAARRLRVQTSDFLLIAVFWAPDFRAPMLVRFLRGLQEAALTCGKKCEIAIHPYESNKLDETVQALGMCNAAIICSASAKDLEFLENHNFPVPVVLYNRHSNRFCTVNVDDTRLGSLAAEVFVSRGHKSAAVLTSEPVLAGMDLSVNSFVGTVVQAGMTVTKIHQENSMEGGFNGAKLLSRMRPLPDCLFCVSDTIAIGAIRALLKAHIRIPEDLELISIGNSDKDLEEFAAVSLSVVHLPIEKMAAACLQLSLDLLNGMVDPPHSIELPVYYKARESCGGATSDDINRHIEQLNPLN